MYKAKDGKGRIVYFEPNDLFGGNNLPVKQEDLTKYVNLSVSIPTRKWGFKGESKKYDSILQGRKFNEKINGEDYTKLYLTDNYVNVSYTEFGKNGQVSNGELFGVESINISFDVQLQPIVVINFVDVRGMGLMGSMEYNYNKGEVNNLTAKSFFTSLFNFPYPIFTLEVKGFYGKSISFDLALKDFHTAFDSTSGNFKTSVSFIGHLYGVYGDIPMSFVLASPYFDYNGSNSSEDFTGPTWNSLGAPNLPTYVKILDKVKEIIKGDGFEEANSDIISDYQKIMEKKDALKNVEQIYEDIISYVETFLDSYCYDRTDQLFKLYTGSENEIQLKNIPLVDPDLNKTVKYLLHEVAGMKIGFVLPYNSEADWTTVIAINDNMPLYEYQKIKKSLDNTFLLNIKTDVHTSLYKTQDSDPLKGIAFLDIYRKLSDVKDMISAIDNVIGEDYKIINNQAVQLISYKLGFTPTIKNIYQLIFKHLNCFSKQFYDTIKKVDPNRNKKTLYIFEHYLTDIKDYDENGIIPPFPMFSKQKQDNTNSNIDIIYPGTIEAFKTQPEVHLVERIYNSIAHFTNMVKKAEEEISTAYLEEETGRKINLNGGNFFEDIDPNINLEKKNYFTCADITNEGDKADKIIDIFLTRLKNFQGIHTEKNNYLDQITSFIDTEVALLKRSNSNVTYNLLTFLEAKKTNVYNIYKEKDVNLKNEGEKQIVNSENCNIRFIEWGDRESCLTRLNSIEMNELWKEFVSFYDNKPMDPKKRGKKFSQKFKNYYYKYFEPIKEKEANLPDFEKTRFGRVSRVEEWSMYMQEGEFNYYVKGQIAVVGTLASCSPVECNFDELNSNYCPLHFKFLSRNSIFTENINLLKLSCTSYKTTNQYIKQCSNDEIIYKSEYNEESNNEYEQNKLMLVSLAHLLAIGEMFCENYNIPLNIFTSSEAFGLAIERGVTFSEITSVTACNNDYKKFLINLYKDFFKNANNGTIEKIENNLGIEINKGDLNKACDIWFIIGREVSFDRKLLDKKEIDFYYEEFINGLYDAFGYKRDLISKRAMYENISKTEENLKTNIYYTLKTLYDKWFCGLSEDFFDMYIKEDGKFKIKNNSEFNKTKYLTTTFNDISDELIVNMEAFANQIISIKENPDNISMSVLSYMARIAQDNQSTFLVLPTNIFEHNLEDAFTTYSYYNGTSKHDEQGSTYIVMHNGDVSHILDNEDSEYSQDGYTIADYRDGVMEITEEAAQIMVHKIESEHDYTIQAFGVTYGMQNQNIFRNVSIDTQTPQVTDYSIANMLNIAEQGSGLANGGNLFTQSQSLYPVYANRSYNCTVEMMGCMNISPLMYFQLNNIPMFKGAYIITNVEHRITPNDFVTTFTGVRVSKYNIPIPDSAFNINRIGRIENNKKRNTFLEKATGTTVSGIEENTWVKKYQGVDYTTIDRDKTYWFPYNGLSSGRTINGETYLTHKDDCLESVRKSIAMIIQQDYSADSSVNGIAKEYTSNTAVVQLLFEKRDSETNLFKLYYEESDCDKIKKYEGCLSYMTSMLYEGKPICVGVTHTLDKHDNCDDITDHWLCIYAYGEVDECTYFKYYESGRDAESACTSDNNVLIYNPNNGSPLFYCSNTNHSSGRRYDVSQVRINSDYAWYYTIMSDNEPGPCKDGAYLKGDTEYPYQPNI